MRFSGRFPFLAVGLLFLVLSTPMLSHEASNRLPSNQTTPPIPIVSAGVVFLCSTPQAQPASIAPGSSGFIVVTCFNKGSGLVQLGTNAAIQLTPTFTLALGFDNITIISATIPGTPCDFSFSGSYTFGTVTVPAESYLNHPIIFANPPTNSSEMVATNYNYCLHYSSAPASGQLNAFSVTWT